MIRIAAYQATPKSTFSQRKKQIVAALAKADQNQVDFLCFPEGFLTGYYEDRDEAIQSSLSISDTSFQEWLLELSDFNATAVIGFNEREGDHIFDSAVVIEKGHLLGVQRKHYLYHDYFTSSNDFNTFQSKGYAWIRITLSPLEF